MSDLVRRFKQHLWEQHHIDPMAVHVNVVNDRVASFGVDPNVAQGRWLAGHQTRHDEGGHHVVRTTGSQTHHSSGVFFDGYAVSETEFDGAGGVQATGRIPR